MKFGKQVGLFLTLGCLAATGSAFARQSGGDGAAARPSRFKFTESIRKEIMTKSGFNSSETESATLGQVKIEGEMPLTSGEGGDFGPSTPVVIKAGNLTFRSTLDKDPNFRPGDNSATLKLTANTSSNKNYIVLATTTLRWDKKKLSIKIEGKTPGAVHSIVAEDFLNNLRGPLDGETKVAIQFGSYTAEATVPFKGKLDHIIRESIDIKGEVITVNLQGELKKP